MQMVSTEMASVDKPTIAVDMDGTLSDWVGALRLHALSKGYPENKIWTEPLKWNFADQWGMTGTEFAELFADAIHNGYMWITDKPDVEGLNVVDELYKAVFPMIVVTHRDVFAAKTIAEERTLNWVRSWNVPIEKIHVTGEDKTAIEWDILIDDKVENIRDAENAGREGYLLAKPWNTGTMKRWYWWEIKNDIMKRFG